MEIHSGVAAVNDTELYFELAGNGPAIVLIHGFTLDARMWDEQINALANDFTVLRYDLRGYGRSAPPNDRPFSSSHDLKALLEYLSLDSATLLGLSMGGGVAVDFVLEFPAMVDALVVADGAISGFDWSQGRPSSWHSEIARRDGVDAAKNAWLNCDLFAPARRRSSVDTRLRRYVADYSGWHWLNDGPIVAASQAALERLGEIQCPTLVIVGEQDSTDFHRIADLAIAGIEDANYCRIPDAGHMSNMENPFAFNSALISFLGML